MKDGKSLTELATELERQKKAKRDFVAPTAELEMTANVKLTDAMKNGSESLRVNGYGSFQIGELGHEQIAGRLGIPQKYYDRMKKEAPQLLAENVNTWFKQEPERRMVRTLDGNVRAFLSDRYRPLDNLPLAEAALQTLTRSDLAVRVESCEVTERRLYIKAVTDRITAEISKGDVVQAGIVISNSEVGCGSVKIEPLVYRLVCTNGMIANDAAMRKYHVGRGKGGEDEDAAMEFFADETKRADDRAFWLKVRDVIRGSFKKDVFERLVNKMKIAAAKDITGSVEKAVEITGEVIGLNEDENTSVLRHLIKGGDLTQWGLVNAVTRSAQDVKSYDRATELERMGGAVLELPQQDWKRISEAE